MTTGRSQTFITPYGTIEFVHTMQAEGKLRSEIRFDPQRNLAVATLNRALRDLQRVGRDLDLVIDQEHTDLMV